MPIEGKTPNANKINPQPRLVGLSQPYFSVELPGAQGGGVIQSLSRKGGGSKLRVLVADDNSTNIEVVSRMLKLEDVSDVTVAKDGQEAYDLVKGTMERNEPFDVIFMDVQMPNVDGLQSTRLIRGIGYKSPIVALTAFSEESNVKECINSGMDEFLSKPIRRPALKQVLKRFATIPEETEGSTRNDEVSNEKNHHSALNGEIAELPTPPATTDDNETELFSGAAVNKAE
jgi:osomolarity two-component system sensor histidine kinase SLN1